jgi:hypothetical protein
MTVMSGVLYRIYKLKPKSRMIFGKKIELKVLYVNQRDFVSVIQLIHGHDFVCVFS